MTKEHIEQFTYSLCYNFFNFMGTIKVPAAVMYAHKIANYTNDILYSKDVKVASVAPSDKLSIYLHYLWFESIISTI